MFRTIAFASLAIAITNAATIPIVTPAAGQLSSSFDGTVFDNCVQITPTFNFHWSIIGTDLCAAHEGSSFDDVYFGFGIVADDLAPNRMAGADGLLTFFDNGAAVAVDGFMNAVQECDTVTGMGVCPDTLSMPAGANDVLDVSGFNQDGIHAVGYTRALLAADAVQDLPLVINMPASYIFAVGPRNAAGLPAYHMANRLNMTLQLDRTPSSDCSQIQIPQTTTVDNNPTTTAAPTPGPDGSGASVAKPEYVMAAIVAMAALL